MAKRKKYDLLMVIVVHGLQQDFQQYQKKHKNISFNRCARAFLVSKKVDYKYEIFEQVPGESTEDALKRFYSVLRADWLGD